MIIKLVIKIKKILFIFKKDVLNLKKNKSDTYWIKKSDIKSMMKDQF